MLLHEAMAAAFGSGSRFTRPTSTRTRSITPDRPATPSVGPVASPSPTAPASALLARRELGWLVNSFRRHLDTTPLAYLRGVRMECAHRNLQGAEPGDGVSVPTLAAKWGFTDLGRFTVDYRRRFGTYLSQTLRS
jgi:hypothetical protein